MTDHAALVRRSLAAESADEFDRRIERQAARLTDAIEAGGFDNDAFTVGLELEAYAVADDDSLRLAELPEDVFDGPAAKELGLHNAELNADPTPLDGAGIAEQAEALSRDLAATRERARDHGLELVLDAMWTVPPESGTDAYLNDVTVEGGPGPATNAGTDDEAADSLERDGDAADSPGRGGDALDSPETDGDAAASQESDSAPVVPGPDADDPVVFARNMRADPRYAALDNEALRRAGGTLPFEVPGATRAFRSILFESLATSIQPHVQVPDASAFPRYHNLAVRTLGPLLALSTNSPFLPADCYDADPETVVAETHHELRIAAFEQSMNQGCRKVRVPDDLEAPTDVVDHVVDDDTFAPFLQEWIEDEADKPNQPDRTDLTERGSPGGRPVNVDGCWEFNYKRGTFWRWVRGVACGDPVEGACDERSLRIEYRPLPTQPTVRDVVGLQVLTAGLLRGLVAADHPLADLAWDDAERSFYGAVEDGLDADLAWVTAAGDRTDDADEIFEEVFSFARHGLDEQGVDAAVQDRYLDPIEQRWEAGVTPSVWKRNRVADAIDDGADLAGAMETMQREYVRLSRETESFAEWL